MASVQDDRCRRCFVVVEDEVSALECDEPGCEYWQHRACMSGVTHSQYERAVDGYSYYVLL